MRLKNVLFLNILFVSCGLLSPRGKPIEAHKEIHMAIKIVSWNPKYFHYVNVTTEDGMISIASYTKHAWGNNITVNMIYEPRGRHSTAHNMSMRMCDILNKWTWAFKHLKDLSDIMVNVCPLPPGKYHHANMQLVPKYLPFIVSKLEFDYNTKLTHTTEKDLLISILFMNRLRNKRVKTLHRY